MIDPLHERLLRYSDIQSVLVCLLQHGLEICQSNIGNVQLMNWEAGYLEIKAQQGFHDEFLNFFVRIGLSDASACARALRNREPIIVEDVTVDQQFAPCREILSRAGIKAVQSTPLLSPSGALVGILSTHFPSSYRPDDRQMRAVRSVAQSAAKAIIQLRANSNGSDRLRSSLKLFRECWAATERADKLLERGG